MQMRGSEPVEHAPEEPALIDAPEEPASAAAQLPIVGAVDSILFVTDKPVSAISVATAIEHPLGQVQAALHSLQQRLDDTDSALELREVGGGWRLYVRADFDPAVSAYVGQETSPRLSQAALETLAVIAYKQPISRGQVAAVRAVNVDSVVRTLLNRGLIQEADIDPDTGATRFETTPQFLSALGINELSDLPPVSPLLPDGQEGFDVP